MGKLKVLQYQQMVPQINSLGLKQRPLQLRHTSRRGVRLLNVHAHKSKIEHETQQTCQVKETPENYLLQCSKYEREREVLFKKNKNYKKRSQYILTLTMEDELGE